MNNELILMKGMLLCSYTILQFFSVNLGYFKNQILRGWRDNTEMGQLPSMQLTSFDLQHSI